jgi:hypothetical protein
MDAASIADIKKTFGNEVYKLPDMKMLPFESQMDVLKKLGATASDLDKYF